MLMCLDLLEVTPLVKLVLHSFPRLETIHPKEIAAGLSDDCPVVQDLDGRKPVALTHVEVVGIVGGSDLHRARSELAIDEFVADDGDLAFHERQEQFPSNQVPVTVIVWVNRDRCVPKHRLGASRRDRQAAFAIDERIGDMGEFA